MTHNMYINMFSSSRYSELGILCGSIDERKFLSDYFRSLDYNVEDDYTWDEDYSVERFPIVFGEMREDEETGEEFLNIDIYSIDTTKIFDKIISFQEFFTGEILEENDIEGIDEIC